MSEMHDQVARLADNVAKLTNEVGRLRRDIAGLHARIEPFEGEVPAQLPHSNLPQPAKRRLVDELERLQEARQTIDACERHVGAMRATLDEIANDSLSREEMKPWLRPGGARKK